MSPARGMQVVQFARRKHDLVGEAFGEIAQDIFHDVADLHARQSMFAANANAGQPMNSNWSSRVNRVAFRPPPVCASS
jgi:hypothetical protein